jgi:uncharacterized glyoxalase superfamily protein PhnB
MRAATFLLLLLPLFAGSAAGQEKREEKKAMTVKKITAVLFVEEVEPSVKFWVERLGFEKTMEVPEGNKIGFAMLQKGNVELMYQSYASADKDVSSMSQIVRKGPTFLYVEVENVDEVIGALKGAEVVIPVRITFYGAKEIGVKEPGGHFITFAQLGFPPPKN